jgi:hypothetical protein
MNSMTTIFLSVMMLQVIPGVSRSRSVLLQSTGHSTQAVNQSDDYVIGNNKDRSKQQGEVRNFLWSHWQQHRTGQLNVTWVSKEGVPSRSRFVLEYDERGVWSIRVTIDRPTLKDSQDAHTEYRVYSVQRVTVEGGPEAKIVDDAQVPGTAYVLVLKDADGKKKTQI